MRTATTTSHLAYTDTDSTRTTLKYWLKRRRSRMSVWGVRSPRENRCIGIGNNKDDTKILLRIQKELTWGGLTSLKRGYTWQLHLYGTIARIAMHIWSCILIWSLPRRASKLMFLRFGTCLVSISTLRYNCLYHPVAFTLSVDRKGRQNIVILVSYNRWFIHLRLMFCSRCNIFPVLEIWEHLPWPRGGPVSLQFQLITTKLELESCKCKLKQCWTWRVLLTLLMMMQMLLKLKVKMMSWGGRWWLHHNKISKSSHKQ